MYVGVLKLLAQDFTDEAIVVRNKEGFTRVAVVRTSTDQRT